MSSEILAWVQANYEWKLSLLAYACIMAISVLGPKLVTALVPTFRESAAMNKAAFEAKMQKPNYAENQKWNRKWGLIFTVIIFAGIIPFTLTSAMPPLWKMALDMFVILMVYDFFYYLVHRFLFHDSGFMRGPLMWVHAVHHRQHNPCRQDSSYIHPIEVAMGLGLYVAVIAALSPLLGKYNVLTIIITWTAFSQINLHNHDLWKADRFPFKYLAYAAEMHHHHHAKFTGGNYATISLLYDWLFGTMDYGDGNTVRVAKKPTKA